MDLGVKRGRNHPEMIDPAVLRAGRFDRKVALPLPDAEALFGVFRHGLPDWREADLRDLAARAAGLSSADVDAAIRQARASARGQDRAPTPADLRHLFRPRQDPAIDRRIALHECGHAIACTALGQGHVRRIFLEREGAGGTLIDLSPTHGTLPDMQDRLTQLLAGRAAERLVLGEVSAGAGGTPDSDLAQATTIATAIHRQYGLGIHGPVWLGPSGPLDPRNGDLLARVRREIERAERRATQILAANRELLEEMAEALASSRDIGEPEAEVWLARVTKGVEVEAEPDTAPQSTGP